MADKYKKHCKWMLTKNIDMAVNYHKQIDE